MASSIQEITQKSIQKIEEKQVKSSLENFVTPEKILKPTRVLNTTKPVSQEQSQQKDVNTRPKIQKVSKEQKAFSTSSTAFKEDPQKSKLRKRSIFEKTPMYLPSKKVKKNFYQSELKVFDSFRKEFIKFRIFKDSDLGNSKTVQKTLKETSLDDDCPTDTEQLQLAKEYVKKQLFNAHKTVQDAEDTKSETESGSDTNDFTGDDFSITYDYSEGLVKNSESKSITKKLCFD